VKSQSKFILMAIDEFKAWIKNQMISRPISLIQNHHTWEPSYDNFNGKNHFDLVVAMEKYQMGPPDNFAQIAQNITTFPDGMIMICRSLNIAPAGIKGANTAGICIEHVGNFDTGHDQMASAHQETILALNAALCMRFDLPADTDSIVYHHWYDLDTGKRTNGIGNVKTCPGTGFLGGNTVKAAQANFIPQVIERMVMV
jgi:N-acetylmuramoyl-L-alanine amidase.